MSKFNDTCVYPKIIVWWNDGNSELTLFDRTLQQAYDMAVEFGYRPPVWYKPWQYITGGLGYITVGLGEVRFH